MRVFAIVKRILRQIRRDKRTLALLFLAPLLILTLMKFVFDDNDNAYRLGVDNVPPQLEQQLTAKQIEVIAVEVAQDKQMMIDEQLDGLLSIQDGQLSLTLTNDTPAKAKSLALIIQQTIGQQADQPTNNVTIDYIYGSEDTALFDTLSPILIGFFVFFFVFLIAGIGLLNERTTGTLERLLATPIKRSEILGGYLLGYGLLACIQTIIVVLFAIHVLDVVLVGSIWHVLMINIITAFVALSLGILLSTFASSEFQMIQFIPLVIVPQIFFSGIFSIEGMAQWLQSIAYIMPLYYVADALKGIMYMGLGLEHFTLNIVVLLAFMLVFMLLNLVALKKYRKL